jgi:hypothetical protein
MLGQVQWPDAQYSTSQAWNHSLNPQDGPSEKRAKDNPGGYSEAALHPRFGLTLL